MLYVECEEIMIEDYEEHFGYPIPRNNKTKKVFEQPEKYTIINYSIWIKNNTSKKLFIEFYICKNNDRFCLLWDVTTENYRCYTHSIDR